MTTRHRFAAARSVAAPPRRVTAWFCSSIGVRIAALSLGLLFAIQIASFSAIGASLGRHARSALPDQLKVGERVLLSLLDENSQRLTEGARLLAADDGFRAAVQTGDTDAIASALGHHGARVGATEVALLGADFAVRGFNGTGAAELVPLLARLAARATRGSATSEVAAVAGRAHQFVLVPMKAPATVGWVLMGFALDAGLVREMAALSTLNVTVLTRASDAAPWTVALTGAPAERAQAFAREAWPAAPAHAAGLQTLRVDGEEFGVRARRLTSAAAGVDAATPQATVLALVSVSVDDAVRVPRDLQRGLAAITLVGFAVFGFASLYTTRRVTTPLRALAAAADRLGAGDCATPLAGLSRDDEIGKLAQAFEKMRVGVGEQQAQILQLAHWDSLTGLPNRAQFGAAVRDAIAQAQAAGPGAGVALIVLDLDRFKHVNDVLGHGVGDLLLGRVGERLSQQMVRGADLVARLGGDEFAVLLRQGDAALAQSVAARLGRAFDAPLTLEEHSVDLGASIGMACWPQHADDADTLLSRAEIALYEAKRRAHGALMYESSIDASSTPTLALLTELRRAVEQGELRLYLQPKLLLGTGRVAGAETLVRWLHPQRGLLAPAEFIPVAEQTGFIRTLTMWVFEEAARHWLALQAEGLALPLSVKLSTRDLLDLELPRKLDALLVKHRVPAEAFCLEITESAIMDDPQRALGMLNRLNGLGFKLSIDGFGTGYSSLAGLKRLPVDELKIDKSFVMNMAEELDDAKIVRAAIDLAHTLGLTVVAEGVENAKIWGALGALDCDEAQGDHLAKPMPAGEFSRWSAAWTAQHRPRAANPAGLTLH